MGSAMPKAPRKTKDKSAELTRLPIPSVLVVGDFRKNSIGFAKKAWQQIVKVYDEEGKSFGPAPEISQSSDPQDYQVDRIIIERNASPTDNPPLYPIPVSDYGRAGSGRFEFNLYKLFRRFNVFGVISCGTAENTKGLAKALEPIDLPVLLTLDSTLSGSVGFGPNTLQLIPNNALQAQAILGKVGVLLGDRTGQLVQVLCSPEDDEYVKDLKQAVQSNIEDNEGSIIRAVYVTDANKLEHKGQKRIIVCLGYYEALGSLIKHLDRECELVFSDGFNDPRVKRKLALQHDVRWYYLTRPVYDPLEHAVDAYRILNRVWHRSIDLEMNEVDLKARLEGFTLSIRQWLEREYEYRYKFVGSANQRGGYFAERLSV